MMWVFVKSTNRSSQDDRRMNPHSSGPKESNQAPGPPLLSGRHLSSQTAGEGP